ncbi:MAG: polyprenyl synthetase family protein [Chlamydiia bacterium]|nr:polyprenyl synthetase family protein [Chlamydiia bacterium]
MDLTISESGKPLKPLQNSKPLLEAFETALLKTLRVPEREEAIVYKAAHYALLTGGKRLRPQLLIYTALGLGASLEKALPAAAALEMIHTYSLIHDDLPAMDNDDLRRGKPTLHKVFDEGQAILAGDLLLTEAFRYLSECSLYTAEEKVRLIQTLSTRSGGQGMIGGQAIDLLGIELSQEALDRLHSLKTGALMAAAVEMGAIVAGADSQTTAPLSRFALKAGLAFQIIDDLLDVTHPENKHGKDSDSKNDKNTYVTLLGTEGTQKMAAQVLQEAIKELAAVPGDFAPLKALAETLVFRTT